MSKFYVALLFIFFGGVLRAQTSPGGVSTNLSLWLRPDGLASGSLATWTYANDGTKSFIGTFPNQPTVVANTFNFWPGINFNGTQVMVGPTGTPGAPLPLNSMNYSIFAVWNSGIATTATTAMRVWAQHNPAASSFDGASVWIDPLNSAVPANIATWGDQPEVSPWITGVSFASPATPPFNYGVGMQAYTPNTTYISELNLLNQDQNDLELTDQTNFVTGATVTSTDPNGAATTNRKLSDVGNFLGARSNSTSDENFNGNLAELIIYTGNPTNVQRSQIFSYLALKYGVALGGNYVSSGVNTYWDATAAKTYGFGSMNYNNNVFGVGMDNGSGLTVTQSNSLATSTTPGVGVSGAGNIVLTSNAGSMADQGFMMIGSNKAGFLTETTTNITPLAVAGSQRLPNQWLVQNTGTVGKVDLSFDFSGITISGTKGGTNVALVVDRDGDGDFTTGTVSQEIYAPTSWDGTNEIATFSQVDLTSASSSSVVISILSNAAAGTPLPVNWVSFGAKANGPDVDLSWTVSNNVNAKVYDVQRSENGSGFSSIGQVSNDPNVKSYGYVDANAGPGTHYYRVLETDQDGKSIYSKIVSASMSGSDFAVRLLNNPVVNGVDAQLEITAGNGGNASMEIWNLGGTRVATLMQEIPNGTSKIRLPMANLAPGTYAVKIRVNDVTQTVQVVKLQ